MYVIDKKNVCDLKLRWFDIFLRSVKMSLRIERYVDIKGDATVEEGNESEGEGDNIEVYIE
jgi:hypothetical protein